MASSASVASAPVTVGGSGRTFSLFVQGEIESAKMDGPMSVFVRFHFVHGPNWEMERGSGEREDRDEYCTQVSEVGGGGSLPLFVYNFPFDVSFHATNPFGWPQIVVSTWTIDGKGRENVVGYGAIHVPCTSGSFSRYIRLFAPITSSPIQQLLASFSGSKPVFIDRDMPAKAEGREVTKVSSSGVVKVKFSIATRNFDLYGQDSTEVEEHLLSDLSIS